MGQPMSARERMLLAFTVCLALLVIPMTALAATGQLVNIADGTNVARLTKVGEVGALYVETRPGIPSGAVNRLAEKTGTGWLLIHQQSGSRSLAVSEMTFANLSTAGAKTIMIRYYVIGTADSCATPTAAPGVTGADVRRVIVPNQTTLQLDFTGVPVFVSAPASGKKYCFGIVVSGPTTGVLATGLTGYTFMP
jgi:hypothetical protein